MTSHRYPQLDALRGVAATGVVLNHLALIYASVDHPSGLLGKLLALGVRIGNPLVVLFFVLSGFVLNLRPAGPYRRFVVRRVCRIYPAVVVTVIGIALAGAVLPTRPQGWMGGYLSGLLPVVHSAGQAGRAVTLVGARFADITFDVPLWSLFHEMWFSLLMPFLAVLLAFNRPLLVAVLGALYVAATTILTHAGAFLPSQLFDRHWMNALLFLTYLPAFALGMLAADAVRRRGAAWAVPGWLEGAAVAAFALALDGKLPPLGVAAACLFLLLCAIGAPVTSWLTSLRPVLFLGRISFSLYLVHLPLLAGAVVALHGRVATLPSLVLGVAAAMLAATAMERIVERPGVRLARVALSREARRG